MRSPAAANIGAPLEIWGGIECTVNRVGDVYHDQLELTGHAGRETDVARIASLGIRRLRYPVLWERVAPRGLDRADWTWTDRRLSLLRDEGIDLIAGLVHHGSGPPYATLADEDFPSRLAEYARAVAERYPWIEAYTPVNEPLTTARFSGLYGHWYPHGRSDREFVRILLNECRGIVLAMQAVRAVNPAARLVQTDDGGRTFSTPPLAYQADFENERRWLGWDLVTGTVTAAHPLWRYLRRHGARTRELMWFHENPCPPSVVGINYYVTSDRFLDHRLKRYPPGVVGGNGRHRYADVESVRGLGAIAGPAASLVDAWNRYRLPLAITEAHLGCTREEQLRWMIEMCDGAKAARDAGADVRAVTAWALFGLSDWDSLVTRVAGHYEPGAFDVRGPVPRQTALAGFIHDLAHGRPPVQPVASGAGWWRSASSTVPAAVSEMSIDRPAVLIVGAGTLGRAFARLCAARNLPYVLLSRGELDINDFDAVEGIVRTLRPWAIVNAAGYVRVDDAECEEETCRKVNVIAAEALAASAARRGCRFVSFSSDLVFGGRHRRALVESDPVAPMSAYGRSKAEAEARVLAAHPGALVARTAAFFGPWDEANAVHLALNALAAGHPWHAPADVRVSPTYVPDLAGVVLDLLVDGASGVWHLANDGDVSWFELVRRAAALCGERTDGLHPCAASDMPWVAPRPTFSVLGTERGQLLPSLDDALARFSRERQGALSAAMQEGHTHGTAA